MDLSKLPRLSETDRQSPAPNSESSTPADSTSPPSAQRPIIYAQAIPAGPEAWISGGMGVLLLLMYPRMLQFVSHSLFGSAFTWTFNDGAGNPLTYRQSVFFWGDLVVTLFCIVLILDAIVLLWARSASLVLAACVITVLTAVANLVYLISTFNQGLAVVSAVAVLYGGYIAIHEWRLFKMLRGQQAQR